MNTQDFVTQLYPEAYKCYEATGIHPLVTLAQCALETGWGEHVQGNNYFGIKDTDGVNGNEVMVKTFEYSRLQNAKFPRILAVDPVTINGQRMYKYTIMDYFRKYDHAADSFIDHGKFLQENKNYAAAMQVAGDCNKCIDAIAKGGYSTSPTYAETLKSIARSIHVIAVHAKITPLVPYI